MGTHDDLDTEYVALGWYVNPFMTELISDSLLHLYLNSIPAIQIHAESSIYDK